VTARGQHPDRRRSARLEARAERLSRKTGMPRRKAREMVRANDADLAQIDQAGTWSLPELVAASDAELRKDVHDVRSGAVRS
jgi:hypothetical protein